MDYPMSAELAAFRSVDFSWVRALQSVWRDSPFHVEALHEPLLDDVFEDFLRPRTPT